MIGPSSAQVYRLVCFFKSPPWPPPFKAIGGIGGVADFMPQATIQQELESRVTQMQEGKDDVDIPKIDTTTPMGQQAYIFNFQERWRGDWIRL